MSNLHVNEHKEKGDVFENVDATASYEKQPGEGNGLAMHDCPNTDTARAEVDGTVDPVPTSSGIPGQPRRHIADALALLVEPGGVAELRAIRPDGVIASGYYNDLAAMTDAIEPMDAAGTYQGIFFTLNPINTALLARRVNHVIPRVSKKDALTANDDVTRRRWLPIDIDPIRPSGISATPEERQRAWQVAGLIKAFLEQQGWPSPIVADSGNGVHLLFRIDLPNDEESGALVKGVLVALDAFFSTETAKVDTANSNAARIWKVYGTVSRKGESTADRQHRRSAIASVPDEITVVSEERLRALAESLPVAESSPNRRSRDGSDTDPKKTLDLGTWLSGNEVEIASEKPWNGGMLYTLAQCPFSDAHTDGAYAIQFPNGKIFAGCHHNSCRENGRSRWPELRAKFEPEYADRKAREDNAQQRRQKKERGSADEQPVDPPVDDAAVAEARHVLEHGDPVRYFLDTYQRDHVGDLTLGECLIASIATQSIQNTKGLHVYATGASGKGKSAAMAAILLQLPAEYRLAERISDKALYYSDDIKPLSVLLIDDVGLSEVMQEVLKEATTKFTERVRMRVVTKNREVKHCTIPDRCAWWLANVAPLYDEQVLNRMLICWVDDSEAQDRDVFARKMANEARLPDEVVLARQDLQVCREIWRQIRIQGLVYVYVPFAQQIRMQSVRNRRNTDMLLDLIKAHALCSFMQRKQWTLQNGTGCVEATIADFNYAAKLYAQLNTTAGALTTKFSRDENLVLKLASERRAEMFSVQDIQNWTQWSYDKARRVMKGYTGSKGISYPGLLAKSSAVSYLDQTKGDHDKNGYLVRNRQLVFTFNEEAYTEERQAGMVWLQYDMAECSGVTSCNPCATPIATPDATPFEAQDAISGGNRDVIAEIDSMSCINPVQAGLAIPPAEQNNHAIADPAVQTTSRESGNVTTPRADIASTSPAGKSTSDVLDW